MECKNFPVIGLTHLVLKTLLWSVFIPIKKIDLQFGRKPYNFKRSRKREKLALMPPFLLNSLSNYTAS